MWIKNRTINLWKVLAAAGLGNTLSDVVGIFFGGYIELVADRMGLPKELVEQSFTEKAIDFEW